MRLEEVLKVVTVMITEDNLHGDHSHLLDSGHPSLGFLCKNFNQGLSVMSVLNGEEVSSLNITRVPNCETGTIKCPGGNI
jgi:hypothetical protein